MNNRFVIVIGSYNNEEWVKQNIESVLCQTHTNFKIVYYNAASTDNTGNIAAQYAQKDHRIILTTTDERHLKTWFFENLEKFIEIHDNDIICILDGDDFMANEDVLMYLNEVYNKINCWVTYGGMIVWNGGDSTQEAFPQNSAPPAEVLNNKLYRKDLWRYSHMRTCRGFLWKKLNKEDLKSKTSGEYMTLDDLSTVYAFLEMTPADKIFRVDQNIYIWNNSKANQSRGCAENKVDNIGQIYENEIRNRPPYKELSIVIPTLAGGLGNQMFEVAAAASLAKDNNAVLVINPNEHILPNQGRNVSNYLTNIFGKIITDTSPKIQTHYSWDRIFYKPIPFQPNVKLGGHYQSYKYFDHNREYIQDLFSPMEKHTYDVTAIQVRRGDYYKFPDHHPLLPLEYYAKAVKMAGNKNILIFGDDMQWCMNNLHFGEDYNVRYMSQTNTSDWQELYTLSECKNLIISNSSFGWWAAYLNKRPDKQVYVPDPWFGKALIDDGFKMDDLILPEWHRIKL
jgi:glycosyltransferase involved in cell wall biosynthesis